MFEQIDNDHSGYLSLDELKNSLSVSGIQESEESV